MAILPIIETPDPRLRVISKPVETFDAELPSDTAVTRALESKWESAQSPTPHTDR